MTLPIISADERLKETKGIKGCIFGFILSSVSCYQGYTVKGGAIQIGEASTRAVVFSDILILIADYVIAAMFL